MQHDAPIVRSKEVKCKLIVYNSCDSNLCNVQSLPYNIRCTVADPIHETESFLRSW